MPTALVQIVLFGIAAGLVVEFLAVLTRAEPAHQKRAYFVGGLLGTAGALAASVARMERSEIRDRHSRLSLPPHSALLHAGYSSLIHSLGLPSTSTSQAWFV